MDWRNLASVETVVAILVGIATLLVTIFGWWKWIWEQVKRVLQRYRPTVPRETVRIVPSPRRTYWSVGSVKGKAAMHAVAHFYATNITQGDVRVLRAFLKKPFVEGSAFVQHRSSNVFGKYSIPPNTTAEISVDFLISPPVREIGQELKTTVVIVDQFGNEHRVKRVAFKPPQPEAPPKPPEPAEAIYAVTDPVEKEVVSVLKSEAARYQICGRRAGGLGSIYITYEGRALTGVGTDSWTPDSPLNQSIVPNPEAARLNSDNLDALVGFYQNLTFEGKERFVGALLRRLGKDTGYASVGYFIVAVLWKIGRLPDALKKAKRDLQGDNQYGLSNALMLLNGLLKYRYPDFSNDILDEIDRAIDGMAEYTFQIPERIAAIRSSRLPKPNIIEI